MQSVRFIWTCRCARPEPPLDNVCEADQNTVEFCATRLRPATTPWQRHMHREFICEVKLFQRETTSRSVNSPIMLSTARFVSQPPCSIEFINCGQQLSSLLCPAVHNQLVNMATTNWVSSSLIPSDVWTGQTCTSHHVATRHWTLTIVVAHTRVSNLPLSKGVQ